MGQPPGKPPRSRPGDPPAAANAGKPAGTSGHDQATRVGRVRDQPGKSDPDLAGTVNIRLGSGALPPIPVETQRDARYGDTRMDSGPVSNPGLQDEEAGATELANPLVPYLVEGRPDVEVGPVVRFAPLGPAPHGMRTSPGRPTLPPAGRAPPPPNRSALEAETQLAVPLPDLPPAPPARRVAAPRAPYLQDDTPYLGGDPDSGSRPFTSPSGPTDRVVLRDTAEDGGALDEDTLSARGNGQRRDVSGALGWFLWFALLLTSLVVGFLVFRLLQRGGA